MEKLGTRWSANIFEATLVAPLRPRELYVEAHFSSYFIRFCSQSFILRQYAALVSVQALFLITTKLAPSNEAFTETTFHLVLAVA